MVMQNGRPAAKSTDDLRRLVLRGHEMLHASGSWTAYASSERKQGELQGGGRSSRFRADDAQIAIVCARRLRDSSPTDVSTARHLSVSGKLYPPHLIRRA